MWQSGSDGDKSSVSVPLLPRNRFQALWAVRGDREEPRRQVWGAGCSGGCVLVVRGGCENNVWRVCGPY